MKTTFPLYQQIHIVSPDGDVTHIFMVETETSMTERHELLKKFKPHQANVMLELVKHNKGSTVQYMSNLFPVIEECESQFTTIAGQHYPNAAVIF